MLSGDCSALTATFKAYTTMVDALRANGTSLFASSGNGGSDASMTAPACVHDVVAVGAVYSRSFGAYTAPFVCRDPVTAPDEIACFSNSSTELDLLAAGAPVHALLQSTGAPVTDARNRFTIPRIDLAAALAQATGRTIPSCLRRLG